MVSYDVLHHSTTLPAHVLQNVPPGLQLADDYSTCAGSEASTIDILLGNDFYHDFVKPHCHQLAPGLYLLDTNLGWMVSGRLTLTSADTQPSTDKPATDSFLCLPAVSRRRSKLAAIIVPPATKIETRPSVQLTSCLLTSALSSVP